MFHHFISVPKKTNAALTGIKQDGIAVLVGHCSSGHLCSILNNKMMEILKQNRDGKGALSESNDKVNWLVKRLGIL